MLAHSSPRVQCQARCQRRLMYGTTNVQRVVVRRAVIAPEAPVQTVDQDVQEVQPKVHVDGIMMQGEGQTVTIRGDFHVGPHRRVQSALHLQQSD